VALRCRRVATIRACRDGRVCSFISRSSDPPSLSLPWSISSRIRSARSFLVLKINFSPRTVSPSIRTVRTAFTRLAAFFSRDDNWIWPVSLTKHPGICAYNYDLTIHGPASGNLAQKMLLFDESNDPGLQLPGLYHFDCHKHTASPAPPLKRFSNLVVFAAALHAEIALAAPQSLGPFQSHGAGLTSHTLFSFGPAVPRQCRAGFYPERSRGT